MIDCMKWLKSATGGGWALAIQKWIRFWSFMIDLSYLISAMKIANCYDFLNSKVVGKFYSNPHLTTFVPILFFV